MQISQLNQYQNHSMNRYLFTNKQEHSKEYDYLKDTYTKKIQYNKLCIGTAIFLGMGCLALLCSKIKGTAESKVLTAFTGLASFAIALVAYIQNKNLTKEYLEKLKEV